ncbi:MAG: tRNA dihydrouridine synthase DusB [Pseudomonadota bacterium]
MLSIAGIDLKNNVIAAPMSGVSDLPFRRAAHRFGAGAVVSEMTACRELAHARADVVRRIADDGEIFPFIVQLAGREERWMAEGAKLAEAAGADIIDINMGCPSRQVTGVASGSALMRDLDHALRLIEATVAATSKPVTVKMRLGWDWSSLNAPELASRAEAAGAAMLTVHGRTRNDFFNGVADWGAVKAVTSAVDIPVIVNGDIDCVDAARAALDASGADGVMVGRASIGRPWLVGAIAAALNTGGPAVRPSVDTERDAVITHYEETVAHYGTGLDRAPLGVRMARKHLAAYVENAPLEMAPEQRRVLRGSICRLSAPADVMRALQALYDGDIDAAMKDAA